MQLPIENHEHASVSLKVVLLVFAIVLAGALGYLVYQQRTAVDSTDYSARSVKDVVPTAKTEETEVASANLVACGDKVYGFELTFGAKWTGYKIKEVKPDYAIVTCYINMPTSSTDEVWTTESVTNFAKYASIFAVSVYTPAQWLTAETEPNKPTKLGENANYVWGWSQAQALPEDLQASKISDDIKNVVATFKIAP